MAESAAGAPGLRRLLIDYDSTLNPGQGNTPLTAERAALLRPFLSRWRGAGVELFVLTASNPTKKQAALRDAELLDEFVDVLSSSDPKRFKSKGDYLLSRISQAGWRPLEQLLVDDSIEAIQSIWQDHEEEPRKDGPLAHTLRLPQHSKAGLVEADLQLLDARVFAPVATATWHAYAAQHQGERFVDEGDTPEKCMLDSLPEEARGEVLRGSPPDRQHVWLQGRPDSAALIGAAAVPSAPPSPAVAAPGAPTPPATEATPAQATPAEPPAPAPAPPAAEPGAAPKGGKAGGKGPPPPKAKTPSQPTADPAAAAPAAAAAAEPGAAPEGGKAGGKGPPPPPKAKASPADVPVPVPAQAADAAAAPAPAAAAEPAAAPTGGKGGKGGKGPPPPPKAKAQAQADPAADAPADALPANAPADAPADVPAPAAVAEPGAAGKGGKGGGKGPPPPKAKVGGPKGPPPPKLGVPASAKAGLSGNAAILARVEAMGKKKDEEEAVEIEQVDLSKIDENARRERVECPRCKKEVLKEQMESHWNSHSSEILPWLFLGGNANAENDKELTIRTGITHILNVAHECNMWDKITEKVEPYNKEQGLGFTYKKMPMLDLPDQDILPHLAEALSFIEEAHQADARNHVLVHCVQGISRSASVVVAYLMKHERMSLRDAHAHVLKCRAIAMPRKEFLDQLGRLECELFGCAAPTLTGEEVFANKSLLLSTLTECGACAQEEASAGPALSFAPPPRGSAARASGEVPPVASAGKGKGKGPGKAPPPKRSATADGLTEEGGVPPAAKDGTGTGKGKGKGPGKGPPPPKNGAASGGSAEEGAAAAPAVPKGKGKGKGPGKAPPPAGARPSITAERLMEVSAARASPKDSGFRKRPSKLSLQEAMKILGAQEPDGSFPAAKCAVRLRNIQCSISATLEADFEALLKGPGEAFATFFALQLMQMYVTEFQKGVGQHPESAEAFETGMATMVHMYGSSIGDKWRERGEEWLATQEVPETFSSCARELIAEWFTSTLAEVRSKGNGLTAEKRRQKEEEQRRKMQEEREREAAYVAHWRSMKACPIESVPWNNVRQTMWCPGGMGGAILVQIGDSEAVVVKPQGQSAVAEAVAQEVADLLGVRIARMRLLHVLNEEYYPMIEAIINAHVLNESQKDFIPHIVHGWREYAGVLEFVPGVVLQGVAGQEALGRPGLRQLLEELGQLIALDCLLNNGDRVPAIWMNDGNLGNVMITSAGSVIGIDQQVNPITDATGMNRYLQVLREFCQDCLQGRTAASGVAGIRTALQLNCGFELSDEAAGWVLAGAAAGFRRIAELRGSLEEALPRIDATMTKIYGEAFVDVGMSRLECILDFVRATVAEISQAVGGVAASPGAPSAVVAERGASPAVDPERAAVVQQQSAEVMSLCHEIKDMVGELKGCLQELGAAAAGGGLNTAAAAAPVLQQVIGAAAGMANSAEAAVSKLSGA